MREPKEIIASVWASVGNAAGRARQHASDGRRAHATLVVPGGCRRPERNRCRRTGRGRDLASAGGRRQQVAVDVRHATVEFRSERYALTEGKPDSELNDRIIGLYRCADGVWVR